MIPGRCRFEHAGAVACTAHSRSGVGLLSDVVGRLYPCDYRRHEGLLSLQLWRYGDRHYTKHPLSLFDSVLSMIFHELRVSVAKKSIGGTATAGTEIILDVISNIPQLGFYGRT